MFCVLKSLKGEIDLQLKVRTPFSNVWGEYKYHGNPYIQGTTVPCDKVLPYLVITAVDCQHTGELHMCLS